MYCQCATHPIHSTSVFGLAAVTSHRGHLVGAPSLLPAMRHAEQEHNAEGRGADIQLLTEHPFQQPQCALHIQWFT